LAIAVVTLGAALSAFAARPGGGGGGTGSNGGGVIYFRYLADLYTMNDDGSGLSLFTDFAADPDAPYGEPSRHQHNNRRWCVTLRWPDGEIVAVSDAGDVFTLPLPPGLEVIETPRWGIGDELISFEGVQWDTDPDSPTFGDPLEGGLYAVAIEADAGGNITGAAGPAELAFEAPLMMDANEDNRIRPDMREHDWAPDGVRFVFNDVTTERLLIGNVLTGTEAVLLDPGNGWAGSPKWSPADNSILFNYRQWGAYPEVALIDIGTRKLKSLVRGSPSWSWSAGVWSPSGSHLLVRYFDHYLQDHYILRMTASGSGKTRLTGKNAYPAAGWGPIPAGWRD
jgi:hypothetical protein